MNILFIRDGVYFSFNEILVNEIETLAKKVLCLPWKLRNVAIKLKSKHQSRKPRTISIKLSSNHDVHWINQFNVCRKINGCGLKFVSACKSTVIQKPIHDADIALTNLQSIGVNFLASTHFSTLSFSHGCTKSESLLVNKSISRAPNTYYPLIMNR